MNAIQPVLEPVVRVYGEPLEALPDDLYIPPDALAVFLETFEGPLDLLLYLIRKQNLSISDIPIAHITQQYMRYIDLMQELNLDLAAEYLVMAAMLAEIKSRSLLPRKPVDDEEEGDPRHELIQRLREYEQFKLAAQDLDAMPRQERDHFAVNAYHNFPKPEQPEPMVDMRDLLLAFQEVLQRADMFTKHQIKREHLSIRARMTHVLARLQDQAFVGFAELFTPQEGRRGAVVTLMAILELSKAQMIDIKQDEAAYSPIYIQTAGATHGA